MLDFLKRNRKNILKILIALLIIVALSVAAMLILKACGVIYWDEEDNMEINKEIFSSFLSSWYGCVIIILLQSALTMLLCFIPGVSMAFILLIQALFAKPWQAFIVAFSGVLLTSFVMYIMGRFGGKIVCEKLLGKEDCQKASELLNNKGAVYFPLMMMFPIFPDDALVMIAGTLKMSMKWFVPSIVIGRGIGICTIIFGLGSIPTEKFTSTWHWVAFIAVCAILIIGVFYSAYRFNKFLENRSKKKNKEN